MKKEQFGSRGTGRRSLPVKLTLLALWMVLGLGCKHGTGSIAEDDTDSSTGPDDIGADADTDTDSDGDGDADALLANGRHWAQVNEVYINNGAGQFTFGYPLGPEKATTYASPAGDLDGDGDLDVIVGNDRAENWVYMNDGAGHFERVWSVGPEIEPTRSAQLADLDGDGALDVLVTNRGTPNGFYLNQGDGRFGSKRSFGDPDGSTIAVAVGDVLVNFHSAIDGAGVHHDGVVFREAKLCLVQTPDPRILP